ncbi:hypothetical protein SAMN04488120_109107 [Fontimonas thermophila]|uniref:Phosphate ABC transporter substrate-binding protein n=1 Tax=Fontimonas thermophila TaxID=1076937 RepID=A0A1I2JXC6_9GAMM|nr:hypothetical protein [Fontimonas thermophila]SFF57416.1 hypothetical protein SAMN04488120_109107 [Fontimonas thermophila]
MRTLLTGLCAVAAMALLTARAAEPRRAPQLVVIVHPSSGVDALTPADAVNIFMGRYRRLPSGLAAFPIDIGDRSPEREAFYRRIVRKDLAEIDAYWARLVFSGQTSPPLKVPDDRAAVRLVASNPAAIAYVDRSAVDGSVKVVLDLGAGP